MAVWGPGYPKYGREGRPIRRRSYRTVKSVKANCDRIWSKLIRARAGNQCERCGATPEAARGFHAHHVYGRTNHRLRWEPRNGMAVCATCHRWAEEYPLEFADWFRDHRYEDADFLAVENQKGLIRRNLQDYLELERRLTELLKEREDAESSESGPTISS